MSIDEKGKHAKFQGEDFVYVTKLIEGQFFDVQKFMRGMQESFTIIGEAQEIAGICKEYSSAVKADDRKPMLFSVRGEDVHTLLFLSDYCTSDKLDVEGYDLPDNFCTGFNPRYLKEATEIFDDKIAISFNRPIDPMKITSGDYKFYILPCNIGEDTREAVNNFLNVA